MSTGASFKPKKILETLFKHDVQCVVLGGLAGTIYGSPLQTSDVDVCPALDKANLQKLAEALKDLDARMMMTDEPDDMALDWTPTLLRRTLLDFRWVNLSTKYGQLDLIHRPDGTYGYKDLARAAMIRKLDGDVEVRVAALSDVIRSKQAAGRQRDLEHLPTLRKLLEVSQARESSAE